MRPHADRCDPRSEAAKHLNEYPYYTARQVREVDNPPARQSYEIGIFEHHADGTETQIGSYPRNYDFLETFWWFRRAGEQLSASLTGLIHSRHSHRRACSPRTLAPIGEERY
jgi:hypothetical protein